MCFRIWKSPLIILLFLGYKANSVAGEPSKLRITRPNGPELSSPLVVRTGQTLSIWCTAANTDSPGTVHWRFPNNSRVPQFSPDSEYDVVMLRYLDNNMWIGLLRMNRTQLSYAGIYTCVADFSGMPKNRSIEIQVSACSEHGALTNGRLRLTNSTTVTYTCDSGYRLDGVSTRHCTANNEALTGLVPRCIPVSCDPAPEAPANGQRNGFGRIFKSTVTYTCNPGYTLQGANTRTCMANKRWSGMAPTCNPVTCGPAPDAPANGQRNGSGTTFGSTVNYTCNTGYILQGHSRRTCMANRQWSGRTPNCSAIKCVLPPRPPVHGRLNGTGLTFGSTLIYSCKEGYTLNGSSTVTCMANRQWSGKAPDCSPISCGAAPGAPANGQLSGFGRIFKSTVTYTCNRGYTLQGDNTRTCMANGHWSGSAPTCSLSCGPAPDAPANGEGSGSGTTVGSTVTYTCNRGYALQGANRSTCMANGHWSGRAPTCDPVSCGPAPNAPANGRKIGSGTTFGSTVTYTCSTGYTPQGDNGHTCMANGEWSGSTPTCNPVSCGPAPKAPANGNRSGSGTTFGTTVTYTCNPGYTRDGPSFVTCTALKLWSGRAPTCNRTSCGPSPDAPANGQQSGSGTTVGSTVTYTCSQGYTLQGANISTCMANGDWSERAPTCDPVSCGPAPKAPANGRQIASGTTFGSTVTYTCNLGYTLQGDNRHTCMANGEWSGRTPTCNPVSCVPAPDVPANGHRNVSGTTFGSAVTFSCNQGYTREGPSRVTCTADEVWSGRAPTCNPVICGPAPDAPANGQRNGSGTTFGSTVNYTCNRGYNLQGDSTRTCMANGRWSGVTTRCSRTPIPNVTLAKSSLDSLLIRWSVSSTEYLSVTNYTVYWSGPFAETYKTISTGYNNYTIKGLRSNSPYNVTVEAIDPLGRQNSTNQLYFTLPAAPSMTITILPELALQVMWTPAPDASRSSLTYVINVTVVSGDTEKLFASVTHPISMENFTGFSSYSVGGVLLQATNPGAMSKAVTVSFRMVNLSGEVSNLTAEWINNTTLRVKWEPVQVTDGVSAAYTVNSSPIIGITDELQNLSEANVTEFQMSKTTTRNFIIMDNLQPSLFYHIRVMVHLIQLDHFQDSSVAIGIGSTVALIVLATTAVLSTILCCCLRWKRHSSHVKRFKGIISTQRASQKSELNEPVAMADLVTLELDDVNDKEVDNQAPPDPVYSNAGVTHSDPNAITKRLFPARVREMHRNGNEGFEEEFQLIHDDPNGSSSIAQLNKSKNRYLNTNTFDHSRVILRFPDENGSDYINASYIAGYVQANKYIAAQGPKCEEVSIFWQMIWEHQPSVVVMLTNVKENGKQKCEQYWNNDLDKPYDAGRGFSVVTTGYRSFADYEVRDLTIRKSTDRPHKLTHFQYTAWPDHGVPLHPSSLVKFVQEVRKVHGNSPAPMVVHCSAGVGRTGTFITLDAMMERLKEKDDLNIFEFVNEMRTRRKQMVQTLDQYAFIHDALSDHITCGDTSMMAHELRGAIVDLNKKDGTRKSGFEQQFEFMDSVCKVPVGEDLSFAKKSMVAKRNRYKEKFPYSTNYLHIAGRPPNNAADYINATMMASYSNKRGLVAAQAPLESTRTDVWELIWQLKTKNIVLLGPVKEGKKVMCSQFWPTEELHSVEYGQLVVTIVSTTIKPDWEMTILQVSDKNRSSSTSLNVTLFHFHSWPREGRPPIDSMLKMMGEVEKKQKDIKAPLMVMCDDGMSRSGVFITCMTEIERVKVEGGVDIFQTVKAARAQRPHMVYTSDQYKLCFEILQSHLDSFDTYANFKAV